jgi:hypothetical protein
MNPEKGRRSATNKRKFIERLPAFCELFCPGKSQARSFGGQAAEIDGAAVAGSITGSEIDVTPELRRHCTPSGRRALDPAFCSKSTCASVVEGAGRCGRHVDDMTAPDANADSAP